MRENCTYGLTRGKMKSGPENVARPFNAYFIFSTLLFTCLGVYVGWCNLNTLIPHSLILPFNSSTLQFFNSYPHASLSILPARPPAETLWRLTAQGNDTSGRRLR